MKRYAIAIYSCATDENTIQVIAATTPSVAIVEAMASVIEADGESIEDAAGNLECLNEILHAFDTYERIKEELESVFAVTISMALSIHAV